MVFRMISFVFTLAILFLNAETPNAETSNKETPSEETTRSGPSDPSEAETPVANTSRRFLEPHLGIGSWKSVHPPELCSALLFENVPTCQSVDGRIHVHYERIESPFEDVDYNIVQRYDNFNIWEGTVRQDLDQDPLLAGTALAGTYYDRIGYGAELDFTLFGANWERLIRKGSNATIDPREFDDEDDKTNAGFFGELSMTRPSGTGSAVWSGVMIGLDDLDSPDHSEDPDWFLGNIRVEIDNLSSPGVDVQLTNIKNQTDGTSRPNMIWNKLPLTNEGLFFDEGANDVNAEEFISGGFNGPDHQEVGGQFRSRRNGISGSFGAAAQQ